MRTNYGPIVGALLGASVGTWVGQTEQKRGSP